MDPISLSQDLIRCPSITPKNEGALELLQDWLSTLGFTCRRYDAEGIGNLFAYKGSGSPHFCFAGHTDVVPLGDASLWTCDPFKAEIKDGFLWGRWTSDMKCAIASFIAALAEFLKTPFQGTISLLITGDEEGEAIHGTQHVLPLLENEGHIPDLCLIGEPTSLHKVGDTLKIGRRGSVTGKLVCYGKQGHIAYPQNTDNPIPRLMASLQALYAYPFDAGTEFFESSRFEVTSIDVGNPATNIIPYKVEARFGIRLNTLQDADDLCEVVRAICAPLGGKHELSFAVHGNAFLTKDQDSIQLIQQAVQQVTGEKPNLCTAGGTTDGRFISAYCPVIECGMKEETMHQVDERVPVDDIQDLRKIYFAILKGFFLPESSPSGREKKS